MGPAQDQDKHMKHHIIISAHLLLLMNKYGIASRPEWTGGVITVTSKSFNVPYFEYCFKIDMKNICIYAFFFFKQFILSKSQGCDELGHLLHVAVKCLLVNIGTLR